MEVFVEVGSRFEFRLLWMNDTSASPYVKRIIGQNECMDFVDRVLFSRDKSSSIRKLKLSLHYCWDFERLKTWLMFAATQRVKEVHIESIAANTLLVPGLLFNRDIEVLKLNAYLRLPASIYPARNLKTLQVYLDLFPQGAFNVLTMDLSLCLPALETLIIKYNDGSPLRLFEQIYIMPTPLALKLHTPCLRSLHFTRCCSAVDYYPKDIASGLVSVAIGSHDLHTYCLVEALKDFCNLTTLKLSGRWRPLFGDPPWNQLFALKNLKWFSLRTTDSCILTIADFLKTTPFIENIVLEIHKRNQATDWGELSSFKHKFCQLRHVTIKNLQGCKNELKVLEFILKNVVVLESITVTPLRSLYGRERVLRETMRYCNYSISSHRLVFSM